MRMTIATLASGTALSLILTATPASAQDSRPPSAPSRASASDSIADIIVTARRVEERLQDVPISITVFNQQQLTNRNVTNLADLANYTPSLSANTNFGSENTSFAIRGFVQDVGTPPSVGVYFADVVAPRGPSQGTQTGDGAGPGVFFDLQNVQVLKGPQGTLQGRNTTGGAVLFVPTKPAYNLGAYVEGSYGNYDMYRVQGMINIPISDAVRFRAAFDRQERDGYLHNISGIGPSDYNDIGYVAARASLVVDLSDELENYLIGSYTHSNTNGSVQKLIGCNPAGSNPVDLAAGLRNFIGVFSCGQLARERKAGTGFYDVEAAVPNPLSRLTQWQVINTTTLHATDTLTIKNIASYGELKDRQRSPLFGTNWNAADLPAPYPSLFFLGIPRVFTGVFPAPGLNTADQYTATEEFQLQGSAIDNRLTWQAGAYYERSRPLGQVGNQSPQIAACSDVAALACSDPVGAALTALTSAQASAAASAAAGFPVTLTIPIRVGSANYTVGRTAFRDVGLYAQASYALTGKLKLTGGFRYTWDRQTNVSQRITYNFPVIPPFAGPATGTCTDPSTAPGCGQSLEQTSHKPTWLVGLDFKPVEDILLYAKYTRGYRAGGVFTNAPIDHRTFQPEKVDSYEAGVKSSFRGAIRGTFNLSVFYNDFNNQQLQFGFDTAPGAPVSPTTAIINAGKSRIYGAEVEASISPFAGFVIDGSYTYLNATIRSIVPVTTADPNYVASFSQIASGTSLVLSPKNKASVTGTYTLPLDASIGRVALGATYTHTDRQNANYTYQSAAVVAAFGGNLGRLAQRNILNLNVSWEKIGGTPVDLSLFATNVTKEKYYSYVPGLATSGSEYAVLGEPRMYGVRARYTFGGR
jgi:iron complex outermembrane receptor protein